MSKYGRRISGEEYDAITTMIGIKSSADPSRAKVFDRMQFNAMIAYRLGVSFPQEKRNALWEINQRENRWWKWLFRYFSNMFSSQTMQENLAQDLIEKYQEVLTKEEAKQFFELD